MKTDTTKTKDTKKPECECGCGETTNGGRFKPGHDAKLKSALVNAALDGDKKAASKLEGLGWIKFLEAKRAKLSKKAGAKTSDSAVEAEPKKRGRGRPRKVAENGQDAGAPRRRGGHRKKGAGAEERADKEPAAS